MTDRIALGLVGCGFFARNHLHAWKDLAPEGVDLVAVCDIDPKKAEAAAQEFGAGRWYTDAAKMFAEERLDLVDIATTMPTHLPLVQQTIARGIPTIVQKPFGQDIGEVRTMVAAAEQAGVFLAVHENFRYQKPMREIARLLGEGAIGTPNWGRISFRTGYDIYAGQPYLLSEKRFVLLDLGVHVLDVARVLLGEIVHITSELQTRNPRVTGEDTATMLCRHQSGAVSVVECTYASYRSPDPFPGTLMEIEGESGSIALRADARIEVQVGGEVTVIDADPEVPAWGGRPWHLIQDSVRETQRSIVRSLKAGKPAPTSGADNMKTFALCEAAYLKAGKIAV